MTRKFYFDNGFDQRNFIDKIYKIANMYGWFTLLDVYDLLGEGEKADYLDNEYIWLEDTFLHNVSIGIDDVGRYYVTFPEPDRYPASDKVSYKHCECRTTWRNTGKSKKTPTPEPFNITVNMDPSKDPNTTIREVIQQANEIEDRPVFITIN